MIYISHLLPDQSMRKVLEMTGGGVESIEFSIAENLDHLNQSISLYRQRMKEMEVKSLILHGPFLELSPMAFDSKIRKVTKERFAEAYTAAQELEAKKILFHSGMNPTVYFLEGWAERTAEFFEEFMDGRTDIEVVMENVLDPLWKPVEEVAQRVKAPNFHLCLDAGHAHCYSEEPIEEWAEKLVQKLTHIHLHDNMGDRDAHLAVGDGTIPWEKVMRVLSEKENMTWTIECRSEETVLKSMDYLKKWITNAE